MNIELTMKGDLAGIAGERESNDRFRAGPGAVWLSASVIALGADSQARIVEAVRNFAGFDDDPWDAHDIGDVEVMLSEPGVQRWRELVFFRVSRSSVTRQSHDLRACPPRPQQCGC